MLEKVDDAVKALCPPSRHLGRQLLVSLAIGVLFAERV
jgi:hypothetical protein